MKRAPSPDMGDITNKIFELFAFLGEKNIQQFFQIHFNEPEKESLIHGFIEANGSEQEKESLKRFNGFNDMIHRDHNQYHNLLKAFITNPNEQTALFYFLGQNPTLLNTLHETIGGVRGDINIIKDFIYQNQEGFEIYCQPENLPAPERSSSRLGNVGNTDDASTLSSNSNSDYGYDSGESGGVLGLNFYQSIKVKHIEATFRESKVHNLIRAIYSPKYKDVFAKVIQDKKSSGTEDERNAIANLETFSTKLGEALKHKMQGNLGTVNYGPLFQQNLEGFAANPKADMFGLLLDNSSQDPVREMVVGQVIDFLSDKKSRSITNIAEQLSAIVNQIIPPEERMQPSGIIKPSHQPQNSPVGGGDKGHENEGAFF